LKIAKVAALAAAVALAAAPAQAAGQGCLTQAQVEDMTLFFMPSLLDALAAKCGPSLPASAYILNGGKTLSQRLLTETAPRWAGASSALRTMAGQDVPAGLSQETARGLIRDMATGELLAKLKPDECARLDEALNLLSPLPPENLAGLIYMLMEVGIGKKPSKTDPKLCPRPQP
jgi:hypothetical protein